MGYFPVRYESRVVNYDRRGFIRLATGLMVKVHVTFRQPLFSTCCRATFVGFNRKVDNESVMTGKDIIVQVFSIFIYLDPWVNPPSGQSTFRSIRIKVHSGQ